MLRGTTISLVSQASGTPARGSDADLVYADGVDLKSEQAVPIGVTCRLCERSDCDQRAMPTVGSPLRVDENLRGMSFYANPE